MILVFHLNFQINFFFLIRLDRLLSLLSTGDSLAVKRSAATQIGQVVSTHPEEVELILNKVNHKKYEGFNENILNYLSLKNTLFTPHGMFVLPVVQLSNLLVKI